MAEENNLLSVSTQNEEQVMEDIRNKLKSGWALLFGHPLIFHQIEYELYTPGTDANAGFELIGFPNTVALCKKTPEFRQKFKEEEGTSIISVCALRVDDNTFAFETGAVDNEENADYCIGEIVTSVAKYLSEGLMLHMKSPEPETKQA